MYEKNLIIFIVLVNIVSGIVFTLPDYPFSSWEQAYEQNYSKSNRENDYKINWIIIHVAQGSFQSTVAWFKNPKSRVSAHFVVSKDGSKIVQMVRIKDVAWHAGNLQYNRHSIGIEIEGYVNETIWPDSLYDKLSKLLVWLADQYNISLKHIEGIAPPDPLKDSGIIGHSQVPDPNNPSLGGGRSHHTDPGPLFNWSKLMEYIDKNREWLNDINKADKLEISMVNPNDKTLFKVSCFYHGEKALNSLFKIHVNDKVMGVLGCDENGIRIFKLDLKLGEYKIYVSNNRTKSNTLNINIRSNNTLMYSLLAISGLIALSIMFYIFKMKKKTN